MGWPMTRSSPTPTGPTGVGRGGFGWGGDGVLVGGAQIVTRSLSGGRLDKRLELRGGQYARRLPWGNVWKRLLIAVLCRVNATNSFSSDWFACGISSGTTNLAHSATTDNFVGFGNSSGGTWTYTTGTNVNYVGHPWHRPAMKRGTNWTITSTTGSTGAKMSVTEAVRSVWVVEISRGGTNYSGWTCSPTAARVENDLGQGQFLDILRGTDVLDSTYGLLKVAAATESSTWTWDESTGGLDTFNIGWTNAEAALEISAVLVRRCW